MKPTPSSSSQGRRDLRGSHGRSPWRLGILAGLLGILECSTNSLGSPTFGTDSGPIPPATKREVDFAKDIRPLFQTHCLKCHGAKRQEAGLRLDRRDEGLNGGDSGPMFIAGKSGESILIKYVAGVDPDVVMPPEGDKLSDEQIGLLRGWIDQGGTWPVDP
jgi:mono/diheme cytochrome c family protein